MGSFKNFFRNWFGYSRRERRSTLILLNIIVIVVGVRYIFPFRGMSIKEIPLDMIETKTDSGMHSFDDLAVKGQKQIKVSDRRKAPLNLNTCDSASLEALPGIGPVLSARIVRYRNLIGGYIAVDQLKEVYGLSEETFNMISRRVFADSLGVRRIRINEADYKELIRHPYFKRDEVSAILKYRELSGKITDVQVMIDNNLISPETARKIGGYLEFNQ